MSSVRFSPEGDLLLSSDPRVELVMDEFSQEEVEDLSTPLADRKSYRKERLGSGDQAVVFAVDGTDIAEKTWRQAPANDRDYERPSKAFDRSVTIRDFWKQERPEKSKLYIPEPYAVVEHPNTMGAILMEKVSSTTVSDIRYTSISTVLGKEMAEELGIDYVELPGFIEELADILSAEDSFYRSLFGVVTTKHSDQGFYNITVDYDAAAGSISRINAIDL